MIKIWNEKDKEPIIFLDLKKSISPEGVTVYAKDNNGTALYSILTIHSSK